MKKFIVGLFLLGLLIVGGGLVLMLLYAPPNSPEYYSKMQWLSQHGELYGGFVGPLLTFLTFIGVLFTINLQLEEQAANKKRNDEQDKFQYKQNFERAFFEMLNVHTTIIADMHFRYPGRDLHGRSCFDAYRKELIRLNATTKMGQEERQHLVYIYQLFWNDQRQDLRHYFRYLYNLIRFVDESEGIDKQRYIRILRAQLSDCELVIIFYNCLTARGENLKAYVEKYALLNNLGGDMLLSQSQMGYLAGPAYASLGDETP